MVHAVGRTASPCRQRSSKSLRQMEKKISGWIKEWEQRCYSDGIPDEGPAELGDKVPSYKRIAMAILKCDHPLVSLGFSPPKSEVYNTLKRIEIEQREKK